MMWDQCVNSGSSEPAQRGGKKTTREVKEEGMNGRLILGSPVQGSVCMTKLQVPL
jgi:hypothetical protein